VGGPRERPAQAKTASKDPPRQSKRVLGASIEMAIAAHLGHASARFGAARAADRRQGLVHRLQPPRQAALAASRLRRRKPSAVRAPSRNSPASSFRAARVRRRLRRDAGGHREAIRRSHQHDLEAMSGAPPATTGLGKTRRAHALAQDSTGRTKSQYPPPWKASPGT
jgi:hypothetical protein